MIIREKHTDKMEEILEKEMYADEGFSEIDEEDQRPETQKVMKQERRQQRKNRRKNWKLRNKIAIVLSLPPARRTAPRSTTRSAHQWRTVRRSATPAVRRTAAACRRNVPHAASSHRNAHGPA